LLDRAFGVLSLFSEDRRVLSLTEIANLSGLPKSTTHRIINGLLQLGALERQERGYKIGLNLLGQLHSAPMGILRNAALPALLEMHGHTLQAVHLGILRNREVLIVEKIDHRTRVRIPTAVGSRFPAHSTAMGKALLATRIPEAMESVARKPLELLTRATITNPDQFRMHLEEIAETKVAEDREESVLGLRCIGAAIMCDGVPVGAVSVTFPRNTAKTESFKEFVAYSASMIGRLVQTERHRRRFFALPELPTN
jgi:DNA-binding IclR family transcriptional regulator